MEWDPRAASRTAIVLHMIGLWNPRMRGSQRLTKARAARMSCNALMRRLGADLPSRLPELR